MDAHLTDMEITVLVAGSGSDAMRASLSEHLSSCSQCLARVAAGIRLDREVQRAARENPTPEIDEESLHTLMAALASSRQETKDFSSKRRVLRLTELLGEVVERSKEFGSELVSQADVVPLAADSSGTEELPTLATQDRSLLVRFRWSHSKDEIRAYIITRKGNIPRKVILTFPDRNLSFSVGSAGDVSLPGVTKDDLRSGRIELILEPLSPESN